MTPKQRELARHALGFGNPHAGSRSYRNRYIIDADNEDWLALCASGDACMEPTGGGSRALFYLTRTGAEKALNPGETLDLEDFDID